MVEGWIGGAILLEVGSRCCCDLINFIDLCLLFCAWFVGLLVM